MRPSIAFPKILISVIFLISPTICHAQGLPIDRFCEIFADSAPARVDKIIRTFKLAQRPAEQLVGKANCQSGEVFVLKTSCVGPNRIAILSLSHPNSKTRPSGATRLFHLKTIRSGDESLIPCQELPTE